MSVKVLIVDDEKPARNKVIRFLKLCAPEAVVLEAEDGNEAVDQILSLRPDIVFLDIQMPGRTGFEVLQEIGPEKMPVVVFATAFEEYALKAFDAQATDYLLKPFKRERFRASWERAVKQVDSHDSQAGKIQALLDELSRHQDQREKLIVRTPDRIRFVDPDEILWLKSDEHYVRIGLINEVLYERRSLKELEQTLGTRKFRRIHRTTLINLDYVVEMQPLTHGDQLILMKDGSKHNVSRRYRTGLGLKPPKPV